MFWGAEATLRPVRKMERRLGDALDKREKASNSQKSHFFAKVKLKNWASY